MRNLIKKDLACSGVDYRFCISVVALFITLGLTPFFNDYFITASYIFLIAAPLFHFLSIFNHIEKNYYIEEVFYPIKIDKIVLSRYISYLIITLLSITLIGIITLLRFRILGIVVESFQLNILGLGLVSCVIYGALILPGSFIFGNNNIKVIGVTSFALTLIPIRIFMEFTSYIFKFSNVFEFYNYSFLIQILILFSVMLYIISAFVSIYGFKKKIRG